VSTRWKLTIEYDGRGFCGWQRQENGHSVQAAIEEAIERFAGEAPRLTVAGRTDAGVHAAGQVAHFDLNRAWSAKTVRDALNAHLRGQGIAILAAAPVDPAFDARRSAIRRVYEYRILNRIAPPALERGRVWHVIRPLDQEAMRAAAAHLLGCHDFTSFRAAECQAKDALRTLDRLDVARYGEVISIHAEARSFLHHQVRNMVGTLRLFGEGKHPPSFMAKILAARARAAAGQTAPPDGLTLLRVDYPSD
jgi:tRNA pseudouridine38-40 synthase